MPSVEILNQLGVGFNGSIMLNAILSAYFIYISLLHILKNRVHFNTRKGVILAFAIYIAACIVSSIVAIDVFASVKELLKMLFYFCLILIIPDLIKEKSDMKIIINLLILSAVIPMCYGAFQLIAHQSPITAWIGGRTVIRITGGFTHSNHFAYFISLVGIIVFGKIITEKNKYMKLLYATFFGLILYEVVLTYSRTALMMLILTIVVMLVSRTKNKLTAILVISVLIGSLIFLFQKSELVQERFQDVFNIFSNINYLNNALNGDADTDSFAWRINLWIGSLLLLSDSLLFGFGLQNFVNISNKVISISIDAHNNYVKILVETGVIGFSSFMLVVYQMVKNQFINKKNNSFFYYKEASFLYLYIFLVSFIDPVINHTAIGFLFWTVYASQSRISFNK
ncbi:O-antigen ligase family protein [Paenibacillus planticolens]|nr:O-antigen ligase family protein [Paenibacillus planticolens]